MYVVLPDKKFHANFRYTIKEGAEPSYVTTGSYDSFDSHCDSTMVGFLQELKDGTLNCAMAY
jgi:hypothetical protein